MKNKQEIICAIMIFCICIVGCNKKRTMKQIPCLLINENVHSLIAGQKTEASKKSYYAERYNLINDSSQQYKILLDLNKEKVYMIDDPQRKYYTLTLDQFRRMARANPANMTDAEVTVTDAAALKKIGDYNCQKHIFTMIKLGIESEIWISDKIDAPLELFYTFAEKSKIGNEMTKLLTIMKKRHGYSMLTETTSSKIPGFFSKIETAEVKGMTVSEDFFMVPQGYKETSFPGTL